MPVTARHQALVGINRTASDPSSPAATEQSSAAAYVAAARNALLTDAGVAPLAESAATLVAPTGVIEEMLLDQMAVAHNAAMRLAARASTAGHPRESMRLMNTSLRCMSAFQEAAVTLDRLRRGGQQLITIQHVTVAEGGQAVVAGSIQGGGDGRNRTDERDGAH